MTGAGVTLAVLSLVGGCLTGPEVGDRIEQPLIEDDQPDAGADADAGVTFRQLQLRVFTPSCTFSQCHAGAPPPQAPMSLEPSKAYASLVGRPSTEVSSLQRVNPGQPSASYLLFKLRGQAGTVGGVPTRMPLNKPPLSPQDLTDIEAWIARGAPND